MLRSLRKKVAEYRGEFDALAYAWKEPRQDPDGRVWYAVAPAEMYPAVIVRMAAAILCSDPPAELIDPGSTLPNGVAMNYLAEARALPMSTLLGLLPPGEVAHDPRQVAARNQVLDLARRWFTQALHVKNKGRPMGLHILKDDHYRLG